MKLKELLSRIDGETVICICGSMGAYTDALPWKQIPAYQIMWVLDSEVERIYLDTSDNSVTIELVDLD